MKYCRLILYFSFITVHYSLLAQQESGFTNKAEAKNLMVNGKKEGKWVEYRISAKDYLNMDMALNVTEDSSEANFYKLTIYKSGVPSGIVRVYDKRGKLVSEMPYVNGRRSGTAKQYYKSGKLYIETPFVDNDPNGLQKQYTEEGKLLDVTPYDAHGQQNGVEKYYDAKSGAIVREIPWTKGSINGIMKGYYENGKLKAEAPYTDNKINGVAKMYYEDGKLKSETTCKDGKIVTTKNFDESGNEVK